jgi:hypothetical protein
MGREINQDGGICFCMVAYELEYQNGPITKGGHNV